MRSKKTLYFAWMLVFVVLVCVGCKKNDQPPVDTAYETKDGQKESVEKAIKEIVKKMKADGEKSNDKKIQRSLAKHILKDHVSLMAHFQSQEFEKMAKVMGLRAKVYKEKDEQGNPIWWEGDISVFWDELYKEKENLYPDSASIELEIYADDIALEDLDPPIDKKDCSSTEVFLFRVIALNEDGEEISNQDGGGSKDRDHSGPCPWV